MKFWDILVRVGCLFLPALKAASIDQNLCSRNESWIDAQTQPEGTIVFPLSTERCKVNIPANVDSETQLTLVNVRRVLPNDNCFENYVRIITTFPYDNASYRFCKSVGSRETLTLKSTITVTYKASFQNEISSATEIPISVQYKRVDISRKLCRHVLTDRNGSFQTFGYPIYPQRGECEWVITTGEEMGITIKFNILNAQSLNCEESFIEVRQGESSEASSWVKICDPSQARLINSSASKLWVRVKSLSTQGIGFLATYESTACRVVSAYGERNFNSPVKSFCTKWNLTARPSHIAALSFSLADLPSTDNAMCSGNFIEVWDGNTKTAYCNNKHVPSIIVSKGQNLVVTYHSTDFDQPSTSTSYFVGKFQASFTSILPSTFNTNCFVQDRALSFRCNNQQVVPCAWRCDNAMQCADNSDENTCPDMEARWQKLQLFVIVMGSICASTVIFCVGLVCFRKCIVHEGSSYSSRSRLLSTTDQSPLTPNADLPSPPPRYFTNRDEEPPATVLRGTYFFGDEFSQSGIHSASLFGIPPPRYQSTESLHRSSNETRSIWQRGMSSIPLVPADGEQNEQNCPPEEGPPGYDSVTVDKDEQINVETPEVCEANFCNDVSNVNNEISIELQTHAPSQSDSLEHEQNADVVVGITNSGATIAV